MIKYQQYPYGFLVELIKTVLYYTLHTETCLSSPKYDLSPSTFSSGERAFQVEYAMKAVGNSIVIGIIYKHSIAFGV
uniref:Proteasome alpha-type subunits domain-containing protein n=1 Tax=Theropithecus gelada TaxID=9565 RepID=A0A8D2FAE2_THEGE